MTAVFLSNAKHITVMNNQKQTRRIKSAKLRQFFDLMADEICAAQEKVTLSLTGNTFEIHLEGGSVNITINEEGGRK